jgi:hypothetical protein
MAGRTKALGAGFLTALACAGLAAAAFAGVHKYDTELTGHINAERDRSYRGYVKSEVHKCEPKRLVVLFRMRPGTDRKAGADRSDRRGFWDVDPRGGGRFYAEVRPKSGNGWVCRADRAPEHGAFGHAGR